MSRIRGRQVGSLLGCSLVFLSLAVPAYTLDCVKLAVNRTGGPQSEQLVFLGGAELIEDVLTGDPFLDAEPRFGPVFQTPLRFFNVPGGAIPSTPDLNPPSESVCKTGFSVADHEFVVLGWFWAQSPNFPSFPLGDLSVRFETFVQNGVPMGALNLRSDSGRPLDILRGRISARLGELPLEDLQTDPPHTGGRQKSPEELAEEGGNGNGNGNGNSNGGGGGGPEFPNQEFDGADGEDSFQSETLPPPPPPQRPLPRARVFSSDEMILFPDETLLLLLGDFVVPERQFLRFEFPLPQNLMAQNNSSNDLVIIFRGTGRLPGDTSMETGVEIAIADRIAATYPPKLSRALATPDVLLPADRGFSLVELTLEAMDTDRSRDDKSALPEFVALRVLARDAAFTPDDVVFNPADVKRTEVTINGRRVARLSIPVRLRRETLDAFTARLYEISVTVQDPEGPATIVFSPVQVRAQSRPGGRTGPR